MGTYTNRLYIDLLSENTLNYTGKTGKHDYSVLAGYTAQTTSERTAGIVGLGFPTDYIHTLNAAYGEKFGCVSCHVRSTGKWFFESLYNLLFR